MQGRGEMGRPRSRNHLNIKDFRECASECVTGTCFAIKGGILKGRVYRREMKKNKEERE
jgi:hypothetical protein